MRIRNENNLEYDLEDEDFVGADIRAEDKHMVMHLMGTQLYKKPLQSLIREITSNCVDAHREAGIDNPVIVGIEYDIESEVYYLTFQDKGTGMSGQELVDIYSNYFNSTKRNTDKLIGGFGIGSKSPLSYQDLFFITSVKNGLKYECMFSKGTSIPRLDSLNGFEEHIVEIEVTDETGNIVTRQKKVKYPVGLSTQEHSGTLVKVELKSEDVFNNYHNLKKAILLQLSYFDNIYFKNLEEINNYKIFEAETFKFRPNLPLKEIHVCLDNINYPIDFDICPNLKYNIPIGIKFNTGELSVVPNREQLNYDKRTIDALNNKIPLVLKELRKIYDNQRVDIDNFFSFLDYRDNTKFVIFKNENQEYKIPLPDKLLSRKEFLFRGNIRVPKYFGELYRVVGTIRENNYLQEYVNETFSINKKSSTKYILLGNKPTNKYNNYKILSKYPSKEIRFIKRNKLTEKIFKLFDYYHYKFYNRNVYSYEIEEYYDRDNKGKIKYPVLGKTKEIFKFLKFFKTEIFEYLEVENYEDFKATDEEKKEIDQELKSLNKAYQRRINQEVLFRNLGGNKKTSKIKDLEKHKLIIYEINTTSDKIVEFKEFITLDKHIQKYCSHTMYKTIGINKITGKKKKSYIGEQVLFLSVSKTNAKYIENLPNSVEYKNILFNSRYDYLFNPMLKRYKTLLEIANTERNKYRNYVKDGKLTVNEKNYIEFKNKHAVALTKIYKYYEEIINICTLKSIEPDYDIINGYYTLKGKSKYLRYLGLYHTSHNYLLQKSMWDSKVLALKDENLYKKPNILKITL